MASAPRFRQAVLYLIFQLYSVLKWCFFKTSLPLICVTVTIADGLKTSLGELTWPIVRGTCEVASDSNQLGLPKCSSRFSWYPFVSNAWSTSLSLSHTDIQTHTHAPLSCFLSLPLFHPTTPQSILCVHLCWSLDYVDKIVTVSEEDIIAATRLVWQRMKICIEPSAGVPVSFHTCWFSCTSVLIFDGSVFGLCLGRRRFVLGAGPDSGRIFTTSGRHSVRWQSRSGLHTMVQSCRLNKRNNQVSI